MGWSLWGHMVEKKHFSPYTSQTVSIEEKMAILDLILPRRKLSPRPVVIYSKPTDMHGGMENFLYLFYLYHEVGGRLVFKH